MKSLGQKVKQHFMPTFVEEKQSENILPFQQVDKTILEKNIFNNGHTDKCNAFNSVFSLYRLLKKIHDSLAALSPPATAVSVNLIRPELFHGMNF